MKKSWFSIFFCFGVAFLQSSHPACWQEPSHASEQREASNSSENPGETSESFPEKKNEETLSCPTCTLWTDVTFFDGETFQNGSLLLEGKRIKRVFSRRVPRTFSVSNVRSLRGNTVIPGLWDMHVHLSSSAGPYRHRQARPPHLAHLKSTLRSGVTAILDLGSSARQIFAYRERIRSGQLRGPSLYAVGPILTPSGGHPCFKGTPHGDRCLLMDHPHEIQKMTSLFEKYVPDAFKVVLEDGGTHLSIPSIKLPVLQAIQQRAKVHATPLIAHISSVQDVQNALDRGVRIFTHIPVDGPLSQKLLQQLVQKKAIFIPTLTVFEMLWRLSHEKPLPWTTEALRKDVSPDVLEALNDSTQLKHMRTSSYQAWRTEQSRHAFENFERCVKAGVRIVAGTDAGNPAVFHGPALAYELMLYRKHGMSLTQALQAATSHAADLLGVKDRGTIVAGAYADFVILKGDLQKNPALLSMPQEVWKEGKRIDRVLWQNASPTPMYTSPHTSKKEGELCLEQDECISGLRCAQWEQRCVKRCETNAECSKKSVCFSEKAGSEGRCFSGDGCDPLKQDCPNGAACTWIGNGGTSCWFAGRSRPGESCADGRNCEPGAQCNPTTRTCYALCDLREPSRKKCPGTFQSCQSLEEYAGFAIGGCFP